MAKDIIVPAAGESVTEADIVEWKKSDGDYVEMDEALVELETDKASMDLTAEAAGILSISIEDGTVNVGDVLGSIDTDAKNLRGLQVQFLSKPRLQLMQHQLLFKRNKQQAPMQRDIHLQQQQSKWLKKGWMRHRFKERGVMVALPKTMWHRRNLLKKQRQSHQSINLNPRMCLVVVRLDVKKCLVLEKQWLND